MRLTFLSPMLVLCGCAALPPSSGLESVEATDQVPATVQAHCFACHSDEAETRLAGLPRTEVVKLIEGRARLDFSRWSELTPGIRRRRLEQIAEVVEDGTMPHERLVDLGRAVPPTPAERRAISDWARSVAGGEPGVASE